jgi:hypothetical protein
MAVAMLNAVFYVVTLCGSERGQRFEGTYRLHLQGQRAESSKKLEEASCKLLSRVAYSSTLKMEAIYSFEMFVSQLHGVTTHKILLFM